MKLEQRIRLEKRIGRRLVRDLLAAGYVITVNNGGDKNEIPYSSDFSTITNAMFATDEEHLLVAKWGQDDSGKPYLDQTSFVFLVYGNDGWDVIADYGTSLEPVLSPINHWIDELEARA
jgi:hypothetical protein